MAPTLLSTAATWPSATKTWTGPPAMLRRGSMVLAVCPQPVAPTKVTAWLTSLFRALTTPATTSMVLWATLTAFLGSITKALPSTPPTVAIFRPSQKASPLATPLKFAPSAIPPILVSTSSPLKPIRIPLLPIQMEA